MANLPHLDASAFVESRGFKSTLKIQTPKAPQQNRAEHGAKLLRQLDILRRAEATLKTRRAEAGFQGVAGITVSIEIKPNGFLDPAAVNWKRDGIELLNVRRGDVSDFFVVFIPEGMLSAFERRIREFMTEETNKGAPKNAPLVNVIHHFHQAAFEQLWTDESPAPEADDPEWYQLWLRLRSGDPIATLERFKLMAEKLGIEVEPGYVPFPGRIVIAVKAKRSALQSAVELLDAVAEIRPVRPTAEFFLSDLVPAEQVAWMRDLEARLDHMGTVDGAYVTLLDTGVNFGHPLIRPSLDQADMHAVDMAWLKADHHGHGTQMAGLILHGDLTAPLSTTARYSVEYRLESVKILPPAGANPPHLYGEITRSGVERVESVSSQRRRTFAMMTTSEDGSRGEPTEWSATLDRLAAGASGTLAPDGEEERKRRLFVLSTGNVEWTNWGDYPEINDKSTVQSPCQAWNALAVGATTNLTAIDATKWPALKVIAPSGGLAPSSTTSLMWSRLWPAKPDVVAEGGNGSADTLGIIQGPDSVRLLTTNQKYPEASLTDSGDTSAAAADVSRLCAILSARHPEYWPETLRALVVHGARHSKSMRALMPAHPRRNDKEGLLRRFGHGVVSAERTLSSDHKRVTMVLQETLAPYKRGKGGISLNKMNIHDLPWPRDALRELSASTVKLRVTLSYFVDPNPSRRGWQSRFRYQSHGLRFAVQGATETREIFGQRINMIERIDAAEASGTAVEGMEDPDTDGWLFGSQIRGRGSLHSDVWEGNGAQLAQKSHIAVFPVGGWWKDWSEAKKFDIKVRYALVVSLEVESAVDIDLYSPVKTQIDLKNVVVVPGA